MLVYTFTSMWIKKGLVAMLAIMRSAGVAREVNLRNPLDAGNEAYKQEIYPGFETQGRCHQKSKRRVPVGPTKRTDVLTKFYKKGSGITHIEVKAGYR